MAAVSAHRRLPTVELYRDGTQRTKPSFENIRTKGSTANGYTPVLHRKGSVLGTKNLTIADLADTTIEPKISGVILQRNGDPQIRRGVCELG